MTSREARLLLVDDDPSEILAMRRILAQYPDQRFATTGEEALRLASEATPDLILLDVEMPGMSGLDVCEALKADPVLARVPVIFVTSHDAPALELTALQHGAADFITKPLVAAQLTARVRAHLGSKLQVDALAREGVAATAPPGPLNPQLPRILIVDDDIASIHVLRLTLATMGDFYFAKSGKDALHLARGHLPDLILLDAHMPGIDGFDVCRSLKADARFRHVPIVFVTRFSDPQFELRAFDLGAADFIVKPYTAAVVRARVRNLLDLKRRTDADLRAVGEHWRRIGDARIADIVASASDAIVTYNTDNEVVLINAAACRMFGVGHGPTIGSSVRALLGDDASQEDRPEGVCIRATMTRSDASTFPVEISTSRVGERGDRLTTVMLRDIGDRERLEVEIRSRIEAETESRTKTQMMSYVAHEMGNSLNGVLGFAELMGADAHHPLGQEQAKRLEHVVDSGNHLKSLLRDVLDLGRFETGNLAINLRPIAAAHCVHEAAAAVSALATLADVTVSVLPITAPVRISADADRLHQCLLNLLTNSVKYNKAGGWARIEVTSDSKDVTIAVRDNGIGMDDSQRRHLFEPFNRLGRQHASVPGSGLGLVITRQLVEAMKGRLCVESIAGQGSCFAIVLPDAGDG